MTRKAFTDYTMSDGTFLPKGSFVSVNADAVHFNDSNYAHADEFDGFRFCKEDDEKAAASESSVKHQMVTTSVEYVPFGHGKHAWCVNTVYTRYLISRPLAYFLFYDDIALVGSSRRMS